MDLNKMSTAELLNELEKRSTDKNNDGTTEKTVLVFGTIGKENCKNFVEVFEKIKTVEDLNFLDIVKLRSKFNTNRLYQGFYFKTTESDFDDLKYNLNKNNEMFANWVKSTKSIQYINL